MYRPLHRTGVNLGAWLAIVSMALNALWPLFAQLNPGVAHALESRAGAQQGPATYHVAAHHAQHDSGPCDPGQLTPHCAFCSLGCPGFAALAPQLPVGSLLSDAEEFRPPAIEVRPFAFVDYPAAHPRAPPVLV